MRYLEQALHNRNGLIRKGSALVLSAVRAAARTTVRATDYLDRPPTLANSFPKSGTHLLDQIVAGLPDRVNYGTFLSSMTSSFRMQRRSASNPCAFIARTVPGEIVRGHLFYDPQYAAALEAKNFVHFFIYRDPRDIVVSASHYLRHMNRWHRLARRFRALGSEEEGIMLSIIGLGDEAQPGLLPNVAERFANYVGWMNCPQTFAVKYEDLTGPGRDAVLDGMIRFYAARSRRTVDVEQSRRDVLSQIAPEKSHTYRAGKRGGWRDAFTPELKEAFKRVAGNLLIQLGYEQDFSW